MKNFTKAIEKRADDKNVVCIYPEAHIWPYYTGIRNFKDVSFKYPAKQKKPVFCFTTTFKKRLIGKRPRIVVYVDGPFFPDDKLSVRENQKLLRDEVYSAMKTRAEKSNYKYCDYVRVIPDMRLAQAVDVSLPANKDTSVVA